MFGVLTATGHVLDARVTVGGHSPGQQRKDRTLMS